jgi:ABC-type Na+ efflux pump permease subunit
LPPHPVLTIAKYEVLRSATQMRRDVVPVAIGLFVLLVLVTGLAAQSGMHLSDGLYTAGVDSEDLAKIVAQDPRFVVYRVDSMLSSEERGAYDLVVTLSQARGAPTPRGQAALKAFRNDYEGYVSSVYSAEPDLFAAYPLWIESEEVKSELDFAATESGQRVGFRPGTAAPTPEGIVEEIATPVAGVGVSADQLRRELVEDASSDDRLSRYTDVLRESGMGEYRTPSQLSPPLPFDSIIFVFIFIFPLYFTSQFFMMAIMNERIDRRGEPLLATPVHPALIVLGKALPYLAGMLVTSTVLLLSLQAPLVILAALFPVILFFLAAALLIGMTARSFKELSFISIFFSTVATSYLFFPSVFANVHVIALVSPLTLVVYAMQGTPITLTDYLYATVLFYLVSAVLAFAAVRNFTEERLFSQSRLFTRVREFLGSGLSDRHPYASLFALSALLIPFVFMAQMMALTLFFNLPMPWSILLLLVAAAFIEELAKSLGLYALIRKSERFRSWRVLVPAAGAIALGFLAGEKLLLFATLAQITESVFGEVLFSSLQALWMPLLLHLAGVFIVGGVVLAGGRRGYVPGLLLATSVHVLYNIAVIRGAIG